MSKFINDWDKIDYLLYTCKISHIHLRKNDKGSVGNELVFGIFTEDKFYALYFGSHTDIYEHQKLVQIAENNWSDIFTVKPYSEEISNHSSKDFENFTKNKELRCNLFTPTVIKNKNNESIALDNNQHTVMVEYGINGINYDKVPFKAICVYENISTINIKYLLMNIKLMT